MKTAQINPAVMIVGLLAASVPLSLFATSVFIECLFIYWMIEGVAFHREQGFLQSVSSNCNRLVNGLRGRLGLFIKNRPAVVFSSLYLLYLVGCFWSTNMHDSLQDLRVKLPILLLPLLITGIKPFSEKSLRYILIAFVTGTFLGTLPGVYLFVTKHYADTRELSPFIGHIVFSMNVCLAIIILFRYLILRPQSKSAGKIVFFLLLCWFTIFLFILKSLTGIILFATFLVYVMGYFAVHLKRRGLRYGAIALLIIIPLTIFSFIYHIYDRHYNVVCPNLSGLETKTASGNPFIHDTIHFKVENGRYIGLYLCEQELKESWEKRSRLNYNGRNLQGNELRYTIIRYLNSKGFRKDEDGLSKLTSDEIGSIEKGVANAGLVQPFNLSARIEGIFIDYEYYLKTGDANGKSELQRVEYWKAAISLIKQNWLTGVGTGDVKDAFIHENMRSHSKLELNFMSTAHNQYLYMGVAFGIGGIVFFICWLIIPPLYTRRFRDYYFMAFFCIMIVSMLTDDTLRTQAGINFMAFFSTLLLFGREKKPEI
jgi:hypothetical protein